MSGFISSGEEEVIAQCTGCDGTGFLEVVTIVFLYLLILFTVHWFIRKYFKSVLAKILRMALYLSGGFFIVLGVFLSNDEFRDPADWRSVAVLGVVLWVVFNGQLLVTQQGQAKKIFTWSLFRKSLASLVLMQTLAFLPMLIDPYHPNYVTEPEIQD